ncbi:hypothetical protein C5167_025473 [Papaver somniferum]|uniref:Uncharacterized protein n=1 Tax=Papaver somniferum TaxID=3469 RepID=A0A4Y7JVF8_PAPSO|nr:hypothetical protein C5167_025473 [Papaver somniferum]
MKTDCQIILLLGSDEDRLPNNPPAKPTWLNGFDGTTRNDAVLQKLYMRIKKVIALLLACGLPFTDLQKVKVSWRNILTCGIVKISCREIQLATRIPEDAKLEAYFDESGKALDMMVPKHRVDPEEHEVRVIQFKYTDTKESLLQAAHKAPVGSLGFRVQCNKWVIIVRLLMAETSERTVFISDRTPDLIVRLRRNVIRTVLRNISISYSGIPLVDVARKLRLDSPIPVADVESIVARQSRWCRQCSFRPCKWVDPVAVGGSGRVHAPYSVFKGEGALSWRNLPNTEFELERSRASRQVPVILIRGDCLRRLV